jgi:hypothetical protein
MAELRHCAVLQAGAVRSVAEVIERLSEIRDGTAGIAPACGITHFSDLYLTITRTIDGHIRSKGFFADDEYLARLDVVFANRYFDALRAWAGGATPPGCWKLLFDLPVDGEVTALQLAGGGVNAHINLDLAVAVVDTGREMGDAGLDVREGDYTKVNDVFAEDMAGLLRRLLDERSASGGQTDRLEYLGELMTRIVARSRLHAWHDAGKLWPLARGSQEWAAREDLLDEWACRLSSVVLFDLPG